MATGTSYLLTAKCVILVQPFSTAWTQGQKKKKMVQVQPGHMNFGSILRYALIPLFLLTPELSLNLHPSISELSLVLNL